MKNIKLKIFTLSALALLQTTVFCDSSNPPNPPPPSNPYGYPGDNGTNYGGNAITYGLRKVSTTIVEAIDNLRKDTMNALHGTDSNSIVNVLNTIFIGTPGTGTGNNTTAGNQSILDTKIDGYIQNFYTLYATDKNFINNELEIANKTELNYTGSNTTNGKAADILDIEKKVRRGVKKQLNQEIYYDTQGTLLDKMRDVFALLIVKAESGDNNIIVNNTYVTAQNLGGGSALGSLDDSINTDGTPQSILDVGALIGSDGYSKEEGTAANNAKLFISQLIKASPPPKTFSFPSVSPNDPGGSAKLYLPYTNTTANPSVPYTIVNIPTNTPPGGISQYQNMLALLNTNSLYQEYKMKVRSLIALRTLFFYGIFNTFQERYKEKKTDLSMLEKEKYMAMVGLSQTYYNDLKTKSVADVNLETLHTLNKVVYFLYKLHQDNERAQLITSISGIQTPLTGMQDDITYIKPIVTLIKNGCWDLTVQAPNGLAAGNTTRASNCANPQGSSSN